MTLFNPPINRIGTEPLQIAAAFYPDWLFVLLLKRSFARERDEHQHQLESGFSGSQPPDDLEGLSKLDPEAITQIHNRYFPVVYRYARYRLGDEVVAEDVAGETFTRLLEYASRGRGPNKNVRGWLMRTASNLVNDYYRAMYGKPTEELLETLASDKPGPVNQAEAADEKRALFDALNQLTEEQINVLALRFGSGLSLVETADVLGKKPNAIKALQFRAIGALRRHMVAAGADLP